MKIRKIHFDDGEVWKYSIGGSWVNIWGPDGKKRGRSIAEVKGASFEIIAKGRRKGNDDGQITPGEVKNYIEAKLKPKIKRTLPPRV
jgi:hypothetical protein